MILLRDVQIEAHVLDAGVVRSLAYNGRINLGLGSQ